MDSFLKGFFGRRRLIRGGIGIRPGFRCWMGSGRAFVGRLFRSGLERGNFEEDGRQRRSLEEIREKLKKKDVEGSS